MTLPRIVRPETLDALPADDPDARRSRRDLVRVHLAMGTRGLVTRALAVPPGDAPGGESGDATGDRPDDWPDYWPGDPPGDRPVPGRPLDVLELGAGDGTLMLAVARRLAPRWPAVRLTLLDRVDILDARTREAYSALGWEVNVRTGDVLDWAADPHAARSDLTITTLFLHHFEGAALRRLLAGIAARTGRFHAFEPRRDLAALVGSHLIGLLGANAVTREDAVLSVHAGFRGRELSAAWPGTDGWRLREGRAGPFGHGFHAWGPHA